MRYNLLTLFLLALINTFSQHHLIVKSKNIDSTSIDNEVTQQHIFGKYFLLESTHPISKNPNWEFNVIPVIANHHISFYSNEILLRVKKDLSKKQLDRISKFGTLEINKHNQLLYTLTTNDKNIYQVQEKKNILKSFDFIKSVQINQYFTLQDCTNDPLYTYQWYLENTGSPIQYNGLEGADIDVNNAWQITKGDSITVAVMDSGIDTLHPDFTGRLLAGFDAFATDSINTHGYPFLDYEQNAHGTACAGIIGAEQDNNIGISGVAPLVQLVPVRIFFYINLNNQIVPFTNMNALLTGSAYSWNTMGVDVISCSAGLSQEYINLLTIDTTICNEELRLAHTDGRNGKGSVLLFSAGNDNINEVLWPANIHETIAVGASDMCDTRKRPNDCSGENWWGSSYGETLNFVAPGVKIATCDISGSNGYSPNDYAMTFNGTSAACPVAAGVAALLLSENPLLTSNEVGQILNSTCEKVTGYSFDSLNIDGTWNEEVGHGRINAHKALLEVFNAFYSTMQDKPLYQIYPNPSNGEIILSGIKTYSTYVIYDTYGRINIKGIIEPSNPKIDTRILGPGLYFISLNNQTLSFKVL